MKTKPESYTFGKLFFHQFQHLYSSIECKNVDSALYILFDKYRDIIEIQLESALPQNNEWMFARDPELKMISLVCVGGFFHKWFRQTDVLPEAELDMVAWHLIHASKGFWSVLEVVCKWNDEMLANPDADPVKIYNKHSEYF